jgi:hypothetical protein
VSWGPRRGLHQRGLCVCLSARSCLHLLLQPGRVFQHQTYRVVVEHVSTKGACPYPLLLLEPAERRIQHETMPLGHWQQLPLGWSLVQRYWV